MTTPTAGETTNATQGRTLLAYYSRAGENYFYGGRRQLEVGNTQVLAELVRDRFVCDLYRIEAADPYPVGYDETVARNVAEQDADARPGLVGAPPPLDAYSTVLLASPLWNVQPPMIMRTFTDRYDFTGKTVHPVVTYAVSGLGRAQAFYERACPGGRIATGLAVRGEEVGSSGPDVDRWLQSAGLPAS